VKSFSVLITILLLTGILVVSLPLLSIYFQWLADNFSSGVLFWTSLLGMIGFGAVAAVACDMIGDLRDGR